jgi:hypothetical protein
MPTAPLQHGHRRAHCYINVAGKDVTNALMPYLISVRAIDKSDGWNEAHIELDDRDAQLQIPPDDSPVTIELGWAGEGPNIRPAQWIPEGSALQLAYEASSRYVFTGYVESAESGFSRRGGGRRLWIDCKSYLTKGDIKSGKKIAIGDNIKPVQLSDAWSQIAGSAGFAGAVSPGLQGEAQKFFNVNSSVMHAGRSIGQHFGAHMKQIGNVLLLVKNTDRLFETVVAEWGINLISWRIKPFVGRPQYGSAKQDFFSLTAGSWMDISKSIAGSLPFGNASAVSQGPASAPNKQTGGNVVDGAGTDSSARRGTGWVIMNGLPEARADGSVQIIGARPGVDGTYRITEAEHNYSRRGYTTRCDVDDPQLDSSTYQAYGWLDNAQVAVPSITFDTLDAEAAAQQLSAAALAAAEEASRFNQQVVDANAAAVAAEENQATSENAGAGGINFP